MKELNTMLNSKLKYRLVPQVVHYEGTKVRGKYNFNEIYLQSGIADQSTLATDTAVWKCDYAIAGVPERQDVLDITITLGIQKGQAHDAGVCLTFEFEDWLAENYIVIPGAVYNGNRFHCLPQPYPPLFYESSERRLDMPVTVTDIPRLGNGSGPFRIEQTAGDASTPAIGFHDASHAMGCWLLTEQRNRFGNLGLFVEESDTRGTFRMSVVSPCVRSERHVICGRVESQDCGVSWDTGDTLTFHLRLYLFPAKTKSDFLSFFVGIREDITGPGKLCSEFPFSAAWQILEDKYNRDNWCDQRSYYSVGTRETINLDWQIGWVGGCMVTHPLLFSGSDVSRRRALTNLETILTKTQAPSGFFYGLGDGKNWYSDGFFGPHPANMHLVRKSGDALYFLLKQLLTLCEPGQSELICECWKKAIQKLSDAFVNLWKKYGQLGQFVDVESGHLLVGGSTCGAIVSAGLILAARYFDNPMYRDIAEAAGAYYLEQFRHTGATTGGPGEILQAPDSESAFALLESLIVLYEETGNNRWLQGAEEVAQLCMTWCVSYDYQFPAGSLFDKLNIRTAGAVYANAQNKHAAPAICTLSGDSLLKLYRATQNEVYLRQLRAIVRNLPQYISRQDRPIGILQPGWINERVNLSDWEGSEMVGEVLNFSAWPEVSCMLVWQEIPGLYVRPDIGVICCFDNIDVKILHRLPQSIQVELHNPTRFHASMRTLIENQSDLHRPLGIASLLCSPRVVLLPGETKTVTFTKDREIKINRTLRKILEISDSMMETPVKVAK